MKKLIRYRLPVSRIFPKGHPKEGQPTYFVEKIENAINGCSHCDAECNTCLKLHTIRANYPLWKKRMKKVLAGEAVIELFYWDGTPYRSKQIVFATLDKDSGCGIQKLWFNKKSIEFPRTNYLDMILSIMPTYLFKNDGLSLEDSKAWFKGYDLSESMAIIHFTKFRY